MKQKILVVALGGTIGSVKNGSIGLDKNNLKVLDFYKNEEVEFVGASPFSVLSENMSIKLWRKLADFFNSVDFKAYDGVIILHGSDTLAFTAALLANMFCSENIVITAADKPLEDSTSNGVRNFSLAVDEVLKNKQGVRVAYGEIFRGECLTSADINDRFFSLEKTLPPLGRKKIFNKNILIIHPYASINFDNYKSCRPDGILISMYHSVTVPSQAVDFCRHMQKVGVPVFFVTTKSSAPYETAAGIDNIIFSCTVENAYARMLLADNTE